MFLMMIRIDENYLQTWMKCRVNSEHTQRVVKAEVVENSVALYIMHNWVIYIEFWLAIRITDSLARSLSRIADKLTHGPHFVLVVKRNRRWEP